MSTNDFCQTHLFTYFVIKRDKDKQINKIVNNWHDAQLTIKQYRIPEKGNENVFIGGHIFVILRKCLGVKLSWLSFCSKI